jgi:hypothetical protein
MSAASSPIVLTNPQGRQVSLSCVHGEVFTFDDGPRWTEDQAVGFTRLVLAARACCQCFRGEPAWMPPTTIPEHLSVEVRLYALDERDPSIDHVRPAAIPGRAISLAAERLFETAIPADDHSLATDLRLVRWWYRQRQLGLLDDT